MSRSTRRTGHSLEAILVFAKNVHVQRGVVETRKRWWRLAAACTSASAYDFLFDYSPDMEYLEIVSPADFKTVDVAPVCETPDPTPWK